MYATVNTLLEQKGLRADVAEIDGYVGAATRDVGQHLVQRREVPVDVADDGDAQRLSCRRQSSSFSLVSLKAVSNSRSYSRLSLHLTSSTS